MAGERAPRKVDLVFFGNNAGTEPVRDWLKEMGETDRRAIGTDLLRAQWRWPVGMPLCRPMGRVYGKCEPLSLEIAQLGCCFPFMKVAWWPCTDSSRKHAPRLWTT